MNILISILGFLKEYPAAATIFSLIVAGIWPFLKFREYLKDKRFKTYHELIDGLVNEQRNPDRQIKLDRQIAVIFELRNFPSYFPVTKRILTDLKTQWADQPRATKEMEFTLDFISKNWFTRTYRRLKKS
ncbi:hypothetical protein A2757_03015 [Candidatus Giovannonibacteria bacterium RIFCSPHIGHO2_01_FULL_48_47]|nr:MAG: hypothetical protein A2757_03015 [Candidatus Giovannonibacteria bacterium RIFCSPHIGHO2_01_FULL_48_47]OGF68641.1 MAG: hypothetical protein A3D61_00075 [Candidatus Giovannonibacteria bacterium RIFCSPHIGHO2_02_FULL_48_15]OGF88159.1 MAG: hypothetical protein A3B26_00565 [Candidatus Giovannonibacteria bacterium RIFCSPLOWO2_01_FULL_48_47]OGF94621.1 MAG: hypothetical protein A2433_03405 [Candidatus Giovannonibacteria bacterium RIFOXYC1_FULL_48_8]OGF95900.1 MAG: hypothetical protein A2613_03735